MKTAVCACIVTMVASLLAACDDGQRQRLQLEELERQNRADSLMLNDSLARSLAEHFDRHGTPNEQLRAYYILGRTYADRGEVPQALDAYNDAANSADTASTDCDYKTLCRVYAQMAKLFYQQNLFDENLECLDISVEYARRADDTSMVINSYAHKLAAYDILQMNDSVISVAQNIYSAYRQVGNTSLASRYFSIPMRAYIDKGMLNEARRCMDFYETESGYFDNRGDIEKGREAYYDIKGMFYLASGQIDSAEYYYRKELCEGHDFNNQNMASLGLSQVYQVKGNIDSVAKYAVYSYAMKDSVLSHQLTTEVLRIKAMYDYSSHLYKAQQEKNRADRERRKAIAYLVVIAILSAIGSCVVSLQRKKRKAAVSAYLNKVRELERIQSDVLLLRSHQTDKDNLLRENEERMIQLREELEAFRKKDELIRGKADNRLNESPGYHKLMEMADSGTLMSEEDWHDIGRLVIDLLPGFNQYISNRKHFLSILEYRIAILLRLHIRSKSISYMMGISPQYVSKLSKQLSDKLFHQEWNVKLLEENLSEIS